MGDFCFVRFLAFGVFSCIRPILADRKRRLSLPLHCSFWRYIYRHYLLRPLRGTTVPRKILPFRRLLDGIFLATTCGAVSLLYISRILSPLPEQRSAPEIPENPEKSHFYLHISEKSITFAAAKVKTTKNAKC